MPEPLARPHMQYCSLARRLTAVASVVLLCVATAGNCATNPLDEQRNLFRGAMQALQRGDARPFERDREKLLDYPLYPYLELTELTGRLPTLPRADVDTFLNRYGNDLPAVRLRAAWLGLLESRQRWADYLAYFADDPLDTPLRCKHAWALAQNGQAVAASAATADLWLSPRSLPSSCDALIQSWYHRGNPAPDLAWQRFHLAMSAGDPRFATYLTRFLDASQVADAALYQQVHSNPLLVKNAHRFSPSNPRHAQIVGFGLAMLATRDARAASDAFAVYRRSGVLRDEAARAAAPRIASALAAQSVSAALQWIMGLDASLRDDTLCEDAVRYTLRDRDWDQISAALHLLPPALREVQRWQYWLARAAEANGESTSTSSAQDNYRRVRETRSYYGFLAADRVGASYEMQNQPVPAGPEQLAATERSPGVSRARERFLLGETSESRREWMHAVKIMSNPERRAAAKLAVGWGWHQLAIGALIAAEDWNDLTLRFPILYATQFDEAARKQRLDTSWLYAITRQESVFNATIKSPAGALGLMQVMPATAQMTARKMGINYRGASDLLNPTTNVAIGSRYMRLMLDDFQHNRVLAAAAYNAGPGRVRQWLRRHPATVEHDMFVETIPFRETRQYVQNVLSFAVIYAWLQGQQTPLVQPAEKLIRNPFFVAH